MKDKTFLTLAGLFFLLFFGGIATIAIQSPSSTILRAKNTNPSALKSFVVIFPQVGSVGSKLKVTVSMRDVNGAVLPSRSISVSSSLPTLIVEPSNTQTTDDHGQAQFFISSPVAGTATLTVSDVGSNIAIVNIPSVEFTQ